MPCIGTPIGNQTLQQRLTQVDKALKKLEQLLLAGTVKVGIGRNGAVVFLGWKEREGLSDVCVFQSLSHTNSYALKRAVMIAEGASGLKVNPKAVAAGLHSHDSGQTWSKH